MNYESGIQALNGYCIQISYITLGHVVIVLVLIGSNGDGWRNASLWDWPNFELHT